MSENETKANGEKTREGSASLAGVLPPLDFSTFILSLSTSVVMSLGLVENPVTKQTEKEPAVAKQTIDLIALLKDKTKGNLTDEETKLLDDVLHELKVWYCKAIV